MTDFEIEIQNVSIRFFAILCFDDKNFPEDAHNEVPGTSRRKL